MCCVHNTNPGKNCLDAIWSRALQGMSQSAPAVKKLRTVAPYPQFALKSFLVAQSSNAIIQEAINRLLAAQRLWIFPYLPISSQNSNLIFDRSDDWKMHQGMPLLTERIWWRSPSAAIYKPCRGVPSDSWLVMTGLDCALCALVHCAGMAMIERGTQHAVWTCFFPCLFRRAVLCLLVKWHDVSAYFLGLHFILNRLLQLAWECCEAGKRIQLLRTCDMSHINGIFLTAVPSLSLGWGCIFIILVFIIFHHDFCSLAGGRSKARYGCRVSARGYGSPSMAEMSFLNQLLYFIDWLAAHDIWRSWWSEGRGESCHRKGRENTTLDVVLCTLSADQSCSSSWLEVA